jgi:hypothetical protein
LSNYWKISSELLVYHKSKNSHHGGTSVVELDSTLGKLGLLVELVPSEVDVSVTEVSGELRLSGYVLHYCGLKESDESYKLENSGTWDGVNGGPSVWDGGEGVSGVVDVTWKVDSVTGGDLSEECKLGDTSVLELYVTKTVETILVGIIKKSKRIEKSKWWLGSELRLESLEGGGGLGNLGRSEGGGRGGEGGGDDELHIDSVDKFRNYEQDKAR